MKLSVIICAHNPNRLYLSRVLKGLLAQTLPLSDWELLLVDNASQPPIDHSEDLHWHPGCQCIREENLGLAAARMRGIRECAGELIVFVDDDSILDPCYLEIAASIAKARPDLGCWGAGWIEPEYEVPPPSWLAAYDGALAIRKLERDLWSNLSTLNQSLPYGVGMCVRKSIAGEYVAVCHANHLRRSLGRSGGSLASGEDTDIAMLACISGFGTASFTSLKITHLIPQRRTTARYMSRLLAGKAESHVLLSSLYTPPNQPLSAHRLRLLRAKCIYYWIRYVVSGFSVHSLLSLSETVGEIKGYKKLRNLNLLGDAIGAR